MKSPLILLAATLVLAFPKASAAQAVAPANLVGTWAQEGSSKELGWTFRADSTLSIASKMPQGKLTATGRWAVSGDTLTVTRVSAKINGRTSQVNVAKRKVVLEKTKLTLTRLDNNQTLNYERVDSLVTPAPAPAPAADSSAPAPKP